MMRRVLIVGGVAGGASAAARLRRLDEAVENVLIERGPHVSFANCGLPYFIGGEIPEKGRLLVQTPHRLRAALDLDELVIDVLATALKAGLTVHDLADLELAYAPPYGSAKGPVTSSRAGVRPSRCSADWVCARRRRSGKSGRR
jgi:hypothetical protein